MKFQVYSANPVVTAIIEGTAPRPAQLAAARGILPLPEQDMLEVLVAFAVSDDAELSGHASATLRAQDEEMLATAAGGPDVAISVLNYLAGSHDLPQRVHESVISNANTPIATIVRFAKNSENGELLELIASNQQLLIQTPELIDALIANPAASGEAQRRAARSISTDRC
jgi:hypothetical protein